MSMTSSNIEDVTAALAEVLRECLRRGMVLPLVFVAASRNGSVLAIRASADDSMIEVLVEQFEDDIFPLPINIMVLDQHDEAVRITMEAEEITYH
jgi:hypothetical protein